MDAEGNAAPINRHVHAETKYGVKWTLTERPFQPRSDHPTEVEVVYEVPRDFEPWYIQYKLGGARVGLTFKDEGCRLRAHRQYPTRHSSSHPGLRTPAAPRARAPHLPPGGEGNIRTATTQLGKSFFGDQMPMVMQEYNTRQNTEVSRGKAPGRASDRYGCGAGKRQQGPPCERSRCRRISGSCT